VHQVWESARELEDHDVSVVFQSNVPGKSVLPIAVKVVSPHL
jgi:hypothetical protein